MNSNTNNSAPVGLRGLFPDSDSDNDETSEGNNDGKFEQLFEVQPKEFANKTIQIRQFSFHSANANQVWAGTFDLAKYIEDNMDRFLNAKILELGAATGALSIYLRSPPYSLNLITSDIDDGGDVEQNIRFNFNLNGLEPVPHIPYSWGTCWRKVMEDYIEKTRDSGSESNYHLDYIIASDILLYVNAYPLLVQSLTEIFELCQVSQFILSHRRRLSHGKIFFDLMNQAGFCCDRVNSCIYVFTKEQS